MSTVRSGEPIDRAAKIAAKFPQIEQDILPVLTLNIAYALNEQDKRIAALEAQNAALRTAGDAMAKALPREGCRKKTCDQPPCILVAAWDAATKGSK